MKGLVTDWNKTLLKFPSSNSFCICLKIWIKSHCQQIFHYLFKSWAMGHGCKLVCFLAQDLVIQAQIPAGEKIFVIFLFSSGWELVLLFWSKYALYCVYIKCNNSDQLGGLAKGSRTSLANQTSNTTSGFALDNLGNNLYEATFKVINDGHMRHEIEIGLQTLNGNKLIRTITPQEAKFLKPNPIH